MKRSSLALLATVVLVGACTSFGSSSGDEPAPPAEAGVTDAPSGDASSDGDAGAPHFCSTPHLLCDDFDVGVLGSAPTWIGLPPAPELSPSTLQYVSPPSSLRALSLSPTTAFLVGKMNRVFTTLTCQVDVFFEDLSGGATASGTFLRIKTSQSAADYLQAAVYVSNRNLFFQVDSAFSGDGGSVTADYHQIGNVTDVAPRWHHVTVVMTPGQGTVAVDVSDIGAAAPTSYPVLTPVSSAELSLGLMTTSTGSWLMSYDNVFCDASP